MRLALLALTLPFALIAHAGDLAAPAALRACDDENGWPPYFYADVAQGRPTGELVGLSVDVFHRIAQKLKLAPQLDLLPWERCLQLLRSGKYQLALNGSYSEERNRDFLLTRPYYATHSAYFYSRERHPWGFGIKQLADLKRYRVCGLHGYNYRTYGFGPGELDDGAGRFPQLLAKIRADRCDLFIEKREVMAGFKLTDPVMRGLLEGNWLVQAPLDEVPPTGFHIMVSRALPNSQALHDAIDAELGVLMQTGELKQLESHYLP
jgi:polar amino acid transport system substrate-binding protein